MPASKYDTHVKPHIKDIEKWMDEGFTEKSIAACLGIDSSTLRDYKKKYTALARSIGRGREAQTRKLDRAAFKAACGHTVETFETRLDREGNPVKCPKSTYYPPDHKMYILLRHNGLADWEYPSIGGSGGEGSTDGLDKLTDAITASREKHGVG